MKPGMQENNMKIQAATVAFKNHEGNMGPELGIWAVENPEAVESLRSMGNKAKLQRGEYWETLW